ncbi:MAG: TonB family protein, partial [Ectothiorhodospiraceae bacterium]|nr:TonB family protein [Ectothiorhodospiraceae bacterium]
MSTTYVSPMLPWTPVEEEDRRFRRVLLIVFLLFLLPSLLIPFLRVPERERPEPVDVPRQVAELLLEREMPPPPAPAAPQPEVAEPEPPPAPVPEPEPVVEAEPPPPPAPEPEAQLAEPAPPPSAPAESAPDARAEARERARSTGVLALSDELDQARNRPTTDSLRADELSSGGTSESRESRSVVSSRTGSASAGVDSSELSRNTAGGGRALSGRETSQVSSGVDTAAAQTRRAQQRQGVRTDEDIQLVFDRNKSAIFSIYNRALRSDPTLRGKVVLRLTIEASGEVSAVEVVSSELNNDDLERRLLLRVRQLDFGAKDVGRTTITYPIDF